MDLNKAIRKQRKSYIRFLLSMCFIFFILPILLLLSKITTIFFLIYLCIIESLIMIAIIIRVNHEGLRFHYDEYKLKIKPVFFGEEIIIICDKVVLVHTEGQLDELEIIIITTSRFRNKKIKAINQDFLSKYPFVANHYYRIKKQLPESSYYYIVINQGGYIKYELLNKIFVSCVYGLFTEETIETIKKYRN